MAVMLLVKGRGFNAWGADCTVYVMNGRSVRFDVIAIMGMAFGW